jgi:hypothetical protein
MTQRRVSSIVARTKSGAMFVFRGVKNTGSSHATSGVAMDVGPRLAAMQESIASQVFPAALRCAIHAPRKPWVTILGHPSNACVRPMDGFTAARETNAIRALRSGQQVTIHAWTKIGAGSPLKERHRRPSN